MTRPHGYTTREWKRAKRVERRMAPYRARMPQPRPYWEFALDVIPRWPISQGRSASRHNIGRALMAHALADPHI